METYKDEECLRCISLDKYIATTVFHNNPNFIFKLRFCKELPQNKNYYNYCLSLFQKTNTKDYFIAYIRGKGTGDKGSSYIDYNNLNPIIKEMLCNNP